jgi:hypothetical protein
VKEAFGWNRDRLARIMVIRLQERTTRLNGLSKGSKLNQAKVLRCEVEVMLGSLGILCKLVVALR